MSLPRFRQLLLGSALLAGCGLSSTPEGDRPTLRSVGGEALDRLPLVPRLVLRGTFDLRPSDLWLLRGKVSAKDLGQILENSPDDALLARRVPLAAWTTEGALSLAPLIVLEPGQEYAIVAPTLGELAQVSTSPKRSPIWWRWGAGAVRPGGWIVHCTEPPPWSIEDLEVAPPSDESPLGRRVLEPAAIEVDILPGFSDASRARSCVRFQAPKGSDTLLPPQEIGGRYFEPSPLSIDSGAGGAAAFAPSVRVQGSAAFLDLPPAIVEVGLAANGTEDSEDREVVLRAQTAMASPLLLGQFPRGSYAFQVAVLDGQGQVGLHALSFEVGQEQGYPVLSEVLANPLGPEPESEWVEIVNIGRAPLSLAGFWLEDSGGTVELPAVVLPAGGVGLAVRTDYVAGASGDVVPVAEAMPIVLPELADGGISNSGEAIRLRAPSGVVVSEIPAVSTGAGISLARRHLLAPDWVSSFSAHAPPGASPGLENVLD